MTTIRVHHERDYTVIDNSALQDSRLSFVARGIHHLLLSYPDGWEVQVKQLQEQTPKEGRDAIRKALTELKNFGYVVKAKIIHPTTGKVLKWQSVIRETASDSGNLTIKADDLEALRFSQKTENPSCGNQNTEFQSTGSKTDQKAENPQCGKSRHLESPPSGKSVPLISNKDLTSNNGENKNSGFCENTASDSQSSPDSARKSKSQSRKKTKAFDYDSLREAKAFADFWAWYRKLADETDCNPGDKQSAGKAWEEALAIGSLDEIRKGAAIFAKNAKRQQSKIPHAARFLRGAPKNHHPSPYWQSALDSLCPIENQDFTQANQEKAVRDDVALARLEAARRAEGIAS